MTNRGYFIGVLLVVLFSVGCASNDEASKNATGGDTDRSNDVMNQAPNGGDADENASTQSTSPSLISESAPTWHRDIGIVKTRCAGCHTECGCPFALDAYNWSRRWRPRRSRLSRLGECRRDAESGIGITSMNGLCHKMRSPCLKHG